MGVWLLCRWWLRVHEVPATWVTLALMTSVSPTSLVTRPQVSGLFFSYLFLHLYTCSGWGFKLLCHPSTSQWGGFLLIVTLVHMHWLRFQTSLSPGHQLMLLFFLFFSSYFSNFLCQSATSQRFFLLISTLVHVQYGRGFKLPLSPDHKSVFFCCVSRHLWESFIVVVLLSQSECVIVRTVHCVKGTKGLNLGSVLFCCPSPNVWLWGSAPLWLHQRPPWQFWLDLEGWENVQCLHWTSQWPHCWHKYRSVILRVFSDFVYACLYFVMNFVWLLAYWIACLFIWSYYG